MIDVVFNGTAMTLPGGTTLADAIRENGAQPPFAAAVNGAFVPRAAHAATQLADGDRIELVQPVTGG
jgi:sulfur carrier protein